MTIFFLYFLPKKVSSILGGNSFFVLLLQSNPNGSICVLGSKTYPYSVGLPPAKPIGAWLM